VFFAMISIWIRHALECFYFGVYMLNGYAPARKPGIVRLLVFSKRMAFARLLGYTAFFM
jgi:hypothetical protein